MAAGGTSGAAVAHQTRHLFVLLATAVVVFGIAVEVTKPVFLAGHKSAPRGFAGAAVVQRAAGAGGVGAEFGHQVLAALGRAADQHLGHGGHAAVVVGGRFVGPLTVLCCHFHDRQAVDCEFLVHFRGRAGQGAGTAVAVDEEGAEFLVGGGFVVHGQQGACGAVGRRLAAGVQAKVLHAVMVVTGTVVPVGVGAVVFERCSAGLERIAQGVNHLHVVPRRHHHFVGQALAHSSKTQGGQGGSHASRSACTG